MTEQATTRRDRTQMVERPLPADINAERSVLGSVLLERDAIIAVAGWLQPEHFYLEKHARIYDAMLACYNQRIPPDLATVADELRRRQFLDLVGGVAYLGELSSEAPAPVHIEYYAKIVERTATLRRLIEAGGKIAAMGYNEEIDLESVLGGAEGELLNVIQRRTDQDFVHISKIIDAYYDEITSQTGPRSAVVGVPTGYPDMDMLTGGLQRSDLIIVAARPGSGKTSFALSLAYNAAVDAQRTIGFFSLEMSRDQLVHRLLAVHTGVDTHRLRIGRIPEREMQTIIKGMATLSTVPIYIEDTPSLSISEVRARARRLHSSVGLDLVIIDYLQLMTGRRSDNRVQEVGEISRGLKGLARELDIPVIALSQLSRAVETRVSHVPMLSDLRESGSIEQDADMVWFIYREELYQKETEKKGIAEIHIAKHRNGPLGVVPLRFDSATTKFQNLARYPSEENYR